VHGVPGAIFDVQVNGPRWRTAPSKRRRPAAVSSEHLLRRGLPRELRSDRHGGPGPARWCRAVWRREPVADHPGDPARDDEGRARR
jgi:hypothetical protein